MAGRSWPADTGQVRILVRLSGKAIVVTGAARGLGRACAVAFAEEGADLALIDIARDLPGVPYPLGTAGQLADTAALCREHGSAVITVEADVRDLAAVERAVAEAATSVSVSSMSWSNNAGIAAPAGKATHEIDEHEWSLMIDVDLSGAWRMTRPSAASWPPARPGASSTSRPPPDWSDTATSLDTWPPSMGWSG